MAWREANSGYEIEIGPRHLILAWQGVHAGVKPFMKWTPAASLGSVGKNDRSPSYPTPREFLVNNNKYLRFNIFTNAYAIHIFPLKVGPTFIQSLNSDKIWK